MTHVRTKGEPKTCGELSDEECEKLSLDFSARPGNLLIYARRLVINVDDLGDLVARNRLDRLVHIVGRGCAQHHRTGRGEHKSNEENDNPHHTWKL